MNTALTPTRWSLQTLIAAPPGELLNAYAAGPSLSPFAVFRNRTFTLMLIATARPGVVVGLIGWSTIYEV